jgi:hypothetical protein
MLSLLVWPTVITFCGFYCKTEICNEKFELEREHFFNLLELSLLTQPTPMNIFVVQIEKKL